MIKMAKEEEIRQLLLSGKKPKELIQNGYKKPTVYKVHRLLNMGTIRETYSLFNVDRIFFDQDRYLPNQIGTVDFELWNTSDTDLYVYRVGIQPEWLKEEWIAIDSRILLRPNENKRFTLTFDIPELALGEYEIRFGIDGQYLYPSTRGVKGEQYIQWTEPVFIDVKMPSIGYTVFVSHSTKDMFLIRQLEKYLDNYGVDVIIAEDIRQLGIELDEKFNDLISKSNIVLALLSKNALDSEWVEKEINYAYSIQKPILPLVENGADAEVQLRIEYDTFSMKEPIDSILEKITEGLNSIRERQLLSPVVTNNLSPLLIGGIIGFLGGILIASKSIKQS